MQEKKKQEKQQRAKREQERRRSQRMKRDERVLVKIVSSNAEELNGKIARCATRDISQDGVRLRFEEPVPVGSTLDLRINVHDRSGTFILSGRVVWCREESGDAHAYAAGVEFQSEGSEDLEAWRALLDGSGAAPGEG